jgi:hypothetical protein
MFSCTIILVNVELNIVCLFDDVSIILSRSNNRVSVTPNLNPCHFIWPATDMLVKNFTNLGDFCVNLVLIHKRVALRDNDEN